MDTSATLNVVRIGEGTVNTSTAVQQRTLKYLVSHLPEIGKEFQEMEDILTGKIPNPGIHIGKVRLKRRELWNRGVRSVLNSADVVCCTCVAAGSNDMRHLGGDNISAILSFNTEPPTSRDTTSGYGYPTLMSGRRDLETSGLGFSAYMRGYGASAAADDDYMGDDWLFDGVDDDNWDDGWCGGAATTLPRQRQSLQSSQVQSSQKSGKSSSEFSPMNSKPRPISLVIIDEAGQCPDNALAVVMARAMTAPIVLFGDDKQLPPVEDACGPQNERYIQAIRSLRYSSSSGDTNSADARSKSDTRLITQMIQTLQERQREYANYTRLYRLPLLHRAAASQYLPQTMLDTQFRMHPILSIFPSMKFYQSQLKSGTISEELWRHCSQAVLHPVSFEETTAFMRSFFGKSALSLSYSDFPKTNISTSHSLLHIDPRSPSPFPGQHPQSLTSLRMALTSAATELERCILAPHRTAVRGWRQRLLTVRYKQSSSGQYARNGAVCASIRAVAVDKDDNMAKSAGAYSSSDSLATMTSKKMTNLPPVMSIPQHILTSAPLPGQTMLLTACPLLVVHCGSKSSLSHSTHYSHAVMDSHSSHCINRDVSAHYAACLSSPDEMQGELEHLYRSSEGESRAGTSWRNEIEADVVFSLLEKLLRGEQSDRSLNGRPHAAISAHIAPRCDRGGVGGGEYDGYDSGEGDGYDSGEYDGYDSGECDGVCDSGEGDGVREESIQVHAEEIGVICMYAAQVRWGAFVHSCVAFHSYAWE